MIVHVQLFAMAKEIAGTHRIRVELPADATIGDLRRQLKNQEPALAILIEYVAFAVDNNYAHDDSPISPDADIACLPPVSGG